MKKAPYAIPNILDSYRRDIASGSITIEQAARELNKAGWMCFGVADAKRLLKIQ